MKTESRQTIEKSGRKTASQQESSIGRVSIYVNISCTSSLYLLTYHPYALEDYVYLHLTFIENGYGNEDSQNNIP
jgi:hypothetical protein